MTLWGKTVLITGGARGIGKAIAKRLLERGMKGLIMDCDRSAGTETERELRALGPIAFVHGDVGRESDAKAAIATVADRYGGLDALVNNAGIMVTQPLTDLSLEDWRRVIEVNLTGAFLLAKHAAVMLASAEGAIVNIASTRALMSEPNTEAYAASKGGLVALSHALAISLGPRVRVNCISPGWIDTRDRKTANGAALPPPSAEDHHQHPVGRVGQPQDVAALVAYLIGDESRFITGANFVADGGMTRKMIYV